MTDTPQGAWMREYERLRYELECAIQDCELAVGPEAVLRANAARAALDAHVLAAARPAPEAREPRAESVPDGDRWVCDNGHASRWNIKSEHYGGNVCPVCHSWVRLYTLMYPDIGAPAPEEGAEPSENLPEFLRCPARHDGVQCSRAWEHAGDHIGPGAVEWPAEATERSES